MKTTKKQFNIFKKEVERCIGKWKISGWKYKIFHVLDDDNNAGIAWINRDLEQRVVSICFNTEISDYNEITKDEIRVCARHEVAHLLVGRLAVMAKTRHITRPELYEAEEELAHTLSILLP